MRRLVLFALVSCAGASFASAAAIAPGPYYARGDFYSAPGSPGSAADGTWGYVPELQLFDDGLHGDGAANDGVYGVSVTCNTPPGYHEFKIANADWTFNEPFVPEAAFVNGRLYTSTTGETVHFRLDANAASDGWLPDVAVANDHGYPAGMSLELIGSAPELGNWNYGLPLDHNANIWTRTIQFATPGAYEYKFRVTGTWAWANFGLNYNNNYGYNGTFDVTAPDQAIKIEFDEQSGRIRAIPDAGTPTLRQSWGSVKAAYR